MDKAIARERGGVATSVQAVFRPSRLSVLNEKSHFPCHFAFPTCYFTAAHRGVLYCFRYRLKGTRSTFFYELNCPLAISIYKFDLLTIHSALWVRRIISYHQLCTDHKHMTSQCNEKVFGAGPDLAAVSD